MPRTRLLILALAAALCAGLPSVARSADLPPGEPTFFAGNAHSRQLAFRYRLGLRVLGWTEDGTGLYGLFSQSSFWMLDNEDRGYTVESNYEPEVEFLLDGGKMRRAAGFWPAEWDLAVSYSHHSNGIDGDLSRSWNHINGYLYLGDPDHNRFSGSVAFWVPFNREIGNEDITAYAGNGRLTVRMYSENPRRTEFYLASNFSLDSGRVFTNLEASLSVSPRWLSRKPFPGPRPAFALFAQWFVGYGESLIEYDSYQNTIRFGLRLW